MDWITDMSTYATWGFPVDKIPCDPHDHMLGRWCRLEGLVQDQLDNGVDAASGQLSPCATPAETVSATRLLLRPVRVWERSGLWLNSCINSTHTKTGWTQPELKKFLAFLDAKGVRSLDMWSDNGTATDARRNVSCQGPCPGAPTCAWALEELRAWRHRP